MDPRSRLGVHQGVASFTHPSLFAPDRIAGVFGMHRTPTESTFPFTKVLSLYSGCVRLYSPDSVKRRKMNLYSRSAVWHHLNIFSTLEKSFIAA